MAGCVRKHVCAALEKLFRRTISRNVWSWSRSIGGCAAFDCTLRASRIWLARLRLCLFYQLIDRHRVDTPMSLSIGLKKNPLAVRGKHLCDGGGGARLLLGDG